MKTNFLILWIAGIAGIFLSACEKTVYFDIDTQENKLVVNALVQPDSNADATISLSVDPLAVGFESARVNDATISVFKNDLYAGEYGFISDGVYTADAGLLNVEPGDRVRLEVSAPGRTSVSAETSIPSAVPIDEVKIVDTIYVTVSYSAFDSLGNYYEIDTIVPHYQIQITFTDPAGEDHYSLKINYKDAFSETYTCFTTDDPAFIVDGSFGFGNDNEDGSVTLCDEAFFTDISFEGKQKTITLSLLELPTEFITDPKFTFRLSHLSSEYYDYMVSAKLQSDNSDNPFSEPVVVYSNVKNGFGIFAGLSCSFAEIDL